MIILISIGKECLQLGFVFSLVSSPPEQELWIYSTRWVFGCQTQKNDWNKCKKRMKDSFCIFVISLWNGKSKKKKKKTRHVIKKTTKVLGYRKVSPIQAIFGISLRCIAHHHKYAWHHNIQCIPSSNSNPKIHKQILLPFTIPNWSILW